MGLPIDNIFFRILLQAWPIILATIASVLLVFKRLRPKFSGEDLQKGRLRQGILSYIDETTGQEEDPELRYWLAKERSISRSPSSMRYDVPPSRTRYRDYVSLSLLWTLFWVGASVFLMIRILLNSYYYGGEAYFLVYFAIYIVIGLMSYFMK